MELNQLKSFIEVARSGKLNRTAKRLYISQSALSSQISSLEESLDIQLFERSMKGMNLTVPGQLILKHAEEVMRACDQLYQKAISLNKKIFGNLTIGLNTDPSFLRVKLINSCLSKNYPALNTTFQPCQTLQSSEQIKNGLIDIGFCFGNMQEKGITTYKISQVDICIVIPKNLCSNTTTLTWQELAAMPWIWSDCDCPYYVLIQKEFDRFDLSPNQQINAVDEHIIQELVKDGQGVAILREDQALSLESDNYVKIWEGKRVSVPLNIAWMEKRVRDNKIDAVIQIIKKCWEKNQDNIRGLGSNG